MDLQTSRGEKRLAVWIGDERDFPFLAEKLFARAKRKLPSCGKNERQQPSSSAKPFFSPPRIKAMSDEEATNPYANYVRGMNPYDYKVLVDKQYKEKMIARAYMRIVEERLTECVLTHSVNQFVKCKDLREQYHNLSIDRYHGMLFPPGEEPVNRDPPHLIVRRP